MDLQRSSVAFLTTNKTILSDLGGTKKVAYILFLTNDLPHEKSLTKKKSIPLFLSVFQNLSELITITFLLEQVRVSFLGVSGRVPIAPPDRDKGEEDILL